VLNVDLYHQPEKNVAELHQVHHHLDEIINDVKSSLILLFFLLLLLSMRNKTMYINLYSSSSFCLFDFLFSLFLLCVCEIRPKEEIKRKETQDKSQIQLICVLLAIIYVSSLFYFLFFRESIIFVVCIVFFQKQEIKKIFKPKQIFIMMS